MAKIGYLYLNKGVWDGKRVVPAAWVAEATKGQTDTDGIGGPYVKSYGYQWWQDTFGCYSARGLNGQYILVFPDKNLVVVFQCNFYRRKRKNKQ